MTFTEFKQLIPSLSRLYADFLQVILETRLQLCIQQKLSNKIIFPTLCCNLCLALWREYNCFNIKCNFPFTSCSLCTFWAVVSFTGAAPKSATSP